MNRAQADALAKDSVAALGPVAAKHGMSVVARGGTLGANSATLKFEFAVTGSGGRDADAYRIYAGIIDRLPPLGSKFISGGVTYTIAGYRPSARLRPILATSSANGKEYVFTEADVIRLVALYKAGHPRRRRSAARKRR